MICIQCSHRIPGYLSACPNCGRPAETIYGAKGNRSPRWWSRRQPFIDISRLTQRDRIAGICSALLLISLFLPWFGVSLFGVTVTANGLEVHGYLHIVLILCLVILGYLTLRVSPLRSVLPAQHAHERILLAVTTVNAALALMAFIGSPDGLFVSPQYGAFVGVAAALAAAVPLAAAVFGGTS